MCQAEHAGPLAARDGNLTSRMCLAARPSHLLILIGKKYLLGLVPQPNPRGNTFVFGTSSPLTTGNNFICKNLVGS